MTMREFWGGWLWLVGNRLHASWPADGVVLTQLDSAHANTLIVHRNWRVVDR